MTTPVPLYRSRMLTSIHGHRLGLDIDQAIVGPIGVKREVRTISSTVPNTSVSAHGVVVVSGLTSTQGPTQHTLDAPMPGIELTLELACTSTASVQFGSTANGASIRSATAGTTFGQINLIGPGGAVTLVGLTTAAWGFKGTATNVALTTST